MKRERFPCQNKEKENTHRLDVTVQEADRVDALDGLQDLAAETQGGADAEGAPAHTAPQVSQVTTLREHSTAQHSVTSQRITDTLSHMTHIIACWSFISLMPPDAK